MCVCYLLCRRIPQRLIARAIQCNSCASAHSLIFFFIWLVLQFSLVVCLFFFFPNCFETKTKEKKNHFSFHTNLTFLDIHFCLFFFVFCCLKKWKIKETTIEFCSLIFYFIFFVSWKEDDDCHIATRNQFTMKQTINHITNAHNPKPNNPCVVNLSLFVVSICIWFSKPISPMKFLHNN